MTVVKLRYVVRVDPIEAERPYREVVWATDEQEARTTALRRVLNQDRRLEVIVWEKGWEYAWERFESSAVVESVEP